MARRAPRLAKLTPPRLRAAVARDRLFRWFEADDGAALLWVSGVPGAGKTSLVASWLEAAGRPAIWYQADITDRDPGSAYHYLALAAESTGGGPPLPRLGSAHAAQDDAFARLFFREFFGRLPEGAVFVIDNFQEAAEALEPLVVQALEEVPQGCALVVISRTQPGVALSRALAHGQARQLGPEALALDEDEARRLGGERLGMGREEVARALEASRGWAAGFALILEHARRSGAQESLALPAAEQAVFDYLAGLLLREVPDAQRRALLLTALLPRFTLAQAVALTGVPALDALVEHLYRRCLFTDRRDGREAVYEYHALLRAFLRARLESESGEAELAQARVRAAQLLTGAGEAEDALRLLAGARAWDALEQRIGQVAEDWLATGRHGLLAVAIEGLPEDWRARSPRLLRYLAAAVLPTDQRRSRVLSVQAFEQSQAGGDAEESVLAASAAVETYLGNFSEYSSAQVWARRLAGILFADPKPALPDPVRTEGVSAFLVAAILADPAHERIRDAAQEVAALVLHGAVAAGLRLKAGMRLLTYCAATRDFEWAEAMAALLLPVCEKPETPPLYRAWCWLRYAQCLCMTGPVDKGHAYLRRAEELAAERGYPTIYSMAILWQIGHLSFEGEHQALAPMLERLERRFDASRPFDARNLEVARAYVERTIHPEGRAGLEGLYRAVQLSDAMGALWIQVSYRIVVAFAVSEGGYVAEALAVADEIEAMVRDTCFARYAVDAKFAKCFALLHTDADESRRLLTEALGDPNPIYVYTMGSWFQRLLGTVLACAIRENIAPEAVRSLVRRYRVRPPKDYAGTWPTSIAIRTFGRLAVDVEGEARLAGGRGPGKVLELLEALVAFGPRAVPQSRLADLLWPDADGDQAQRSLKVSLHRLRKWLGREDAVIVAQGTVAFDAEAVWVDAWAFERAAECALDGAATEPPGVHCRKLAEAIALYTGPFLPALEAPWAVVPRRRFHQGAEALVRAQIETHLRCGDGPAAKRVAAAALGVGIVLPAVAGPPSTVS